MSVASPSYPRPLIVALMIFAGTLCFSVLFLLIGVLLNIEASGNGTVGTFISAMLVGRYLAGKRHMLMQRQARWLTACWYAAISMVVIAALVALDAGMNHQIFGLDGISSGVLLSIGLAAVVLSVLLSYWGLLLGEKAAVRQAEKL